MVGLPYYREQLLSAWPSTQVYEIGNPPFKIDATILANLTLTDFGGFAPNTRKVRRNQVEKTRAVEINGTALAAPRFLSEKAREPDNDQSSGRRISDAVVEALANASLKGVTKAEVPLMYRNVEIKYSKFGVDDFDFEWVSDKSLWDDSRSICSAGTIIKPTTLGWRLTLRIHIQIRFFSCSNSFLSYAT